MPGESVRLDRPSSVEGVSVSPESLNVGAGLADWKAVAYKAIISLPLLGPFLTEFVAIKKPAANQFTCITICNVEQLLERPDHYSFGPPLVFITSFEESIPISFEINQGTPRKLFVVSCLQFSRVFYRK